MVASTHDGMSGVSVSDTLTMEDPWRWLSAGWRDLWAMPLISLTYGLGFALISAVLVGGLFVLDLSSLVLALAGGFMLVGPMLAVGMYEASRRREAGEPVRLRDVLLVATRSPSQLAFLGVLLMLVLLVWIRLATLIFALFFGLGGFPPLAEFVPVLLFTWNGVAFLTIGSAVGGALAVLVFAMSVISVPMLLAEDRDAMTAVLTSINAVRRNFWPMVLWGWLVGFVTAFGIATLFVGLIVTFPLVGHGTWHAYRAVVRH